MTLRAADAVAADVPALERLINAAYREGDGTPGWTDERALLRGARIDAAMLHADLAAARIIVLRRDEHDIIVACARIGVDADGAWSLSAIATAPAQQGAGIGAALLSEIERQAGRAAVPVLRISVILQRDTLIAWYERRGFRRTGAVLPFPYHDARVGHPLRDDLALVVLEKALSDRRPPQAKAITGIGSG